MRKVRNSVHVDMPEDLQISLFDVPFFMLLMQWLPGQQTTKIHVATLSLLFYLIQKLALTIYLL